MNTLQFYKDAVAVKYGRGSWQDISNEMHSGDTDWIDMQSMLDEAATLYAEEACKEQRRLCSEALHFTLREPVKEYIESAELAVNTEKV